MPTTPVKGKKIIIIGDGPIALTLAIMLKQRGAEDVTIVGDHLNNFTRSGDIHSSVFPHISNAISPLSIVPSHMSHIKDIEFQLYEHAKNLGIKLINKKFTGFEENHFIKVEDKKNNVENLEADILFDCTGNQYDVIKKINEQLEPSNQFHVKEISHPKHNSFALVRAKMNRSEFNNFNENREDWDNVAYTLAIEELQKLGWDNYRIPRHYANPSSNIKLLEETDDISTKFKVNIYLEVPPQSSKENIEKFTKALIDLSAKSSHTPIQLNLQHPSTKHPSKPVISGFPVICHQLSPSCYQGDTQLPITFHAGDASANLPFLTGQSIKRGIDRIKNLLKHLNIENSEITQIDFAAIESDYQSDIKNHTAIMQTWMDLQNERDERLSDLENVIPLYNSALLSLENSDDNSAPKEIIEKGLQKVKEKYLKETTAEYKEKLDDLVKNGIEKNITDMFFDNELEKIKKKLSMADMFLRYFSSEEKSSFQNLCAKLCEYYKEIGDFYANSQPKPKNISATKYYELSLKAYDDLFPDEQIAQKLTLYANLIMIADSQNDYKRVIKLSEKFDYFSRHSSLHDIAYKENANKIFYQISFAYIKMAEINIKKTDLPDKYIKEAQKYLAKLTPDYAKEISELKEKINNLENSAEYIFRIK